MRGFLAQRGTKKTAGTGVAAQSRRAVQCVRVRESKYAKRHGATRVASSSRALICKTAEVRGEEAGRQPRERRASGKAKWMYRRICRGSSSQRRQKTRRSALSRDARRRSRQAVQAVRVRAVCSEMQAGVREKDSSAVTRLRSPQPRSDARCAGSQPGERRGSARRRRARVEEDASARSRAFLRSLCATCLRRKEMAAAAASRAIVAHSPPSPPPMRAKHGEVMLLSAFYRECLLLPRGMPHDFIWQRQQDMPPTPPSSTRTRGVPKMSRYVTNGSVRCQMLSSCSPLYAQHTSILPAAGERIPAAAALYAIYYLISMLRLMLFEDVSLFLPCYICFCLPDACFPAAHLCHSLPTIPPPPPVSLHSHISAMKHTCYLLLLFAPIEPPLPTAQPRCSAIRAERSSSPTARGCHALPPPPCPYSSPDASPLLLPPPPPACSLRCLPGAASLIRGACFSSMQCSRCRWRGELPQ